MPPAAGLIEARAFAESVAGVLERHPAEDPWAPGAPTADPPAELEAALDELGWISLALDGELSACAGLAGVELGRRLAPIQHVDRLLGGAAMAGTLVRSLPPDRVAVDGLARLRRVLRSQPVASAEGLHVERVLEVGEPFEHVPETAVSAWLAAGVGYLGGLGAGALELTVGYVRQRRAFGTTLSALAPVQQLLAGAATSVRGVVLLAGEGSGRDALAHAGAAAARACADCHQVTGALGFTLEYPLHRYTQRARALAAWNEALLG